MNVESIILRYPENEQQIPLIPQHILSTNKGISVLSNSSLKIYNKDLQFVKQLDLDKRKDLDENVLLRHNALTRRNVITIVENSSSNINVLSKDNYITIIKDDNNDIENSSIDNSNTFKFPLIPSEEKYDIRGIAINMDGKIVLYDDISKSLLILNDYFKKIKTIKIPEISNKSVFIKIMIDVFERIYIVTNDNLIITKFDGNRINKESLSLNKENFVGIKDAIVDDTLNVYLCFIDRIEIYNFNIERIYQIKFTTPKHGTKQNLAIVDKKLLISNDNSVNIIMLSF